MHIFKTRMNIVSQDNSFKNSFMMFMERWAQFKPVKDRFWGYELQELDLQRLQNKYFWLVTFLCSPTIYWQINNKPYSTICIKLKLRTSYLITMENIQNTHHVVQDTRTTLWQQTSAIVTYHDLILVCKLHTANTTLKTEQTEAQRCDKLTWTLDLKREAQVRAILCYH